MTSLRRSPSPGARLRTAASRRLALACISALALSLAVAVASAGAIVTTVGTKVGLQPRSTSLLAGVGFEPESFANPNGNPILSTNKTYAIYWDPTDNYHGDWQAGIDAFFHNMGAASGSLASVFAVDAQYTDAANQHAAYASTFMGAYTDTDSYPASGKCVDPHPLEGINYPWGKPDAITCITNVQIETELKLFIADHKLPTGMGTIFYLLTPPGVTVCLDGGGGTGHCSDYEAKAESYEHSFCSYHSDINPGNPANGGPGTILYATIPWVAGGFGDGHLAQIDRTGGYECQDGGFNPSSTPIEGKEEVKGRSPKEEEEFHEKSLKEQREAEEARELGLEAPHQQEPNQAGLGPDGYSDTGLFDLIVSQIGVQQQNIVTNPLLNAWQDPTGKEATDECRNFFATGGLGGTVNAANPETRAGTLFNQIFAGKNYYINDAFNLASLKLPYPGIPCLSGISLDPKFTAPNPVNSGEVVGFDGMESDITLNEGTAYTGTTPKATYATYKWNFGDGSPEVTGYAPGAPALNSPETSPCPTWLTPCAASTFHSYQYGGTYNVKLTVTDTGGNTASVTNPVTVEGPSAPGSGGTEEKGSSGSSGSSGSASSSSGSTSGSSTSTASTTPGAATKPPVPNPVAAAASVSRSLAQVLRSGLIVRYSVNEQVAGRFEVMLASSIAKRIGLHGPPALGLAQGTAPQIVIAKAILVTTRGGRSTIKILFGKKTAARLHKLHKVSLMLRLIVRNASQSPAGTTVISTVTLVR